jgi:hypothetical protein
MRLSPLPSALFLSVLLITSAAFGQSTSPSTGSSVRDPQALATVQTALAAMGGTAAIGQVQKSVTTGTTIDQPATQNSATNFTWTYAGSNFRDENDAPSRGHILVSNGGTPQDFRNGAWSAVPAVISRINLPYHVPALVLLNEINNAGYSIVYIGSTTLNGQNAIHVLTRDDSDSAGHLFTPQDWYFDPSTGLPLSVQYQFPVSQNPVPVSQDPSASVQVSIGFSNYNAVGGILVPLQLNIVAGPISCVATISSVVFNSTIDPSGFTPNTGGAQ